jgi:hypothetical protein
MFQLADHPLLDTIRELDLDSTSPRQAAELLASWQEQLQSESRETQPA